MEFLQECFLVLLVLVLVLVPTILYHRIVSARHRRGLPSPRGLPIIGNLHQLGSLPHQSLHRLSLKHGPLMLIHLGSVPVLIASSVDAARAILRTHDHVFSDRPSSIAADELLYGSRDVGLAPYGEYWKQARRVCSVHLLSHQRVRLARKVREEEVRAMLDEIEGSTPSPVNLTAAAMELANNVVSRVALGKAYKIGETEVGVKELMEEFAGLIGSFDVGEYVKWLGFVGKLSGLRARMAKTARRIDGLLEMVIEDHVHRWDLDGGRRKEEEESFVDVLLRILEEEGAHNPSGFDLDRNSIKGILWDMFVAGTHTTAALIDCAMAEMMRNPEVLMRAQEEARRISGGAAITISGDETERMVYLRMVIRETLRLHPPVPLLLPHQSTGEAEVLGYPVAKGTRVMVNAWALGRDPGEWDSPGEFMPDRFRDSVDKPMWDLSGINGYNFLPFGSGRRGCPGAQFGLSIAELALANLLFRFDWDMPGGRSAAELDMTESPGLIVGRRRDLELIARPAM